MIIGKASTTAQTQSCPTVIFGDLLEEKALLLQSDEWIIIVHFDTIGYLINIIFDILFRLPIDMRVESGMINATQVKSRKDDYEIDDYGGFKSYFDPESTSSRLSFLCRPFSSSVN